MSKIVLEDFSEGDGYYKIFLAYLNKEQVEEIKTLVSKWKPTDEDIINCIGMCLTDVNEQRFKDYGTNLRDCLAWLEKQGEQKATDTVEPKFHEGDWIINKFHDICLITDIDLENSYYICESNRFGNTDGDIDLTDKAFHLWTIQDAEDGDVLANDHHILILKELDYDWYSNGTPYSVKAYCGIKPNGNFELGKDNWCFCGTLHIHPATKEQRKLLFSKMKEAGYEWDAEKKELRKIENSPILSNSLNIGKNEQKSEWTGKGIREVQLDYWRSVGGKEWHGVPVQETIAWLEKQRKTKWSDKDERMMDFCISRIKDELESLRNNKFAHQEILQDCKEGCWERIDWLKSLKKRMEE